MEAALKEEIQIFPDLESLSHKAAAIFIGTAKESIAENGRFSVVISGGSTPARLFSVLCADYRSEAVWEDTHFFWADERCVPIENKESNFGNAYRLLLSKIPVHTKNIHRIRGEDDPEKEALRYETEIRDYFGRENPAVFDLVILGMGDDGHTASLFPGSKSVNETERFAIAVDTDRLKSRRITLTLAVINKARHILFLVSGISKSNALAEIQGESKTKKMYPAGLVNPVSGAVNWLVDEEAAIKLRERNTGKNC
ncbi:MAG: 6-phosphogluconolactonase [Nitrospirota bacterium]